MKKAITTIESSLPTINKNYDKFDIIGNTFGRYFDYKRETAMIEHETKKVKAKAKILGKQIKAELKKSLDENDKNFKKEMRRLEEIGKELKNGAKTKAELLKQIDEYIKMLGDSSLPVEVKKDIPTLIELANQMLAKESEYALKKLNMMSHFDSNTKLIGGE